MEFKEAFKWMSLTTKASHFVSKVITRQVLLVFSKQSGCLLKTLNFIIISAMPICYLEITS